MTQLYVRTSTLDGQAWLDDRRLSLAAKGLAADILPGSEVIFTLGLLSSWSADSETVTAAALAELVAAGYLEQVGA